MFRLRRQEECSRETFRELQEILFFTSFLALVFAHPSPSPAQTDLWDSQWAERWAESEPSGWKVLVPPGRLITSPGEKRRGFGNSYYAALICGGEHWSF
ncbi:unnamed protein product [Strongylus vulgaris]|uniref:Uncharacterized protein n=1 Tax=Strongylus vulgaris TaxID=40348 RepID=A0A3P7HYB4_STRVU|nr:unnamed protein product [Strongylus vulgaris]